MAMKMRLQQAESDLRQLEDAEDNAEGTMQNSWITTEGTAANRALNLDSGDVHAPSLREKRTVTTPTEPPPA